MLKTFPIDFIRQALEQKLYEEHLKDVHLFGGKNQVNILSFYEQLKSQEEVDRFVETYRDLADQQNRSGLILNGVLVSPENPSITNLYSSLIVPMSFTCSMRCTLANRDQGIVTINNLIEKLKGRKVDIAQLNCVDDNGNKYTDPFVVGTIGQNDGAPQLKNGDYIGDFDNLANITTTINNLLAKGVDIDYDTLDYLYCKYQNKLQVLKVNIAAGENVCDSTATNPQVYDDIDIIFEVALNGVYTREQLYPLASASFNFYGDETYSVELDNGIIDAIWNDTYNNEQITWVRLKFTLEDTLDNLCPNWDGTYDIEDEFVYALDHSYDLVTDDGTMPDIIFPPEHDSFEKYKLSFSFDAIRCDEPRNLNGDEYCELSFGGSATLVSKGVQLGNDLLKIFIKKLQIQAESTIDLSADTGAWLEPLELPSGSNANTQISQLVSNNFLSNTHTDALALTLQYTFVLDKEIELLNQWFKYARYGIQGTTISDISPNMEYGVSEVWCSWGEFDVYSIVTKIVESIDIENTESDTLTLTTTMQIQGEWE